MSAGIGPALCRAAQEPAIGRFRTPASVLGAAWARGPRAVPCRGLAVAALAFSEGALRCSLREGGCDAAVGTAGRGAHLTASRRPGGYAGLPLAPLRCSPAPMRPVRALPSGPGTRGVSRALEYMLPPPARLRAGGPGSEWAAPSSAGRAAARASALRELTRGNCLSGASTARAASFAAGRGTEQHRGEPGRARVPADSCPPGEPVRLASRTVDVGAQRRPPTAERTGPPARSLARLNATTVNATQATNGRSRANVRNGPFADLRSFLRSCEARRSH
jgi:hypothetical protein